MVEWEEAGVAAVVAPSPAWKEPLARWHQVTPSQGPEPTVDFFVQTPAKKRCLWLRLGQHGFPGACEIVAEVHLFQTFICCV